MTQKGLIIRPSGVGEVPVQRPSADPGSLDPRQYAEFLKVMQRSALRRRRHRPDTQQGGMPPAARGTAPYARRLHRLRRPGCPACCAGGGPAAPAAGGGAAERGGGAAGDARLRRVQQRRAQPHRQPAHHDARRRAGGAGGRAVLGPGEGRCWARQRAPVVFCGRYGATRWPPAASLDSSSRARLVPRVSGGALAFQAYRGSNHS